MCSMKGGQGSLTTDVGYWEAEVRVSSAGMGGDGECSAHYRLENPPHRNV